MAISLSSVRAAAPATGKLRVLLVQGGHDFQTNEFLKIFGANPAITFRMVQQPHAQEWFKPSRAADYDVLVLYDLWQQISDDTKADLLALIKGGKGLLALHHSLCSYQKWDEYAQLIGGKYHLEKWRDHGVEKPASTYRHDVDFTVHVSDRDHPVTHGIEDFAIHDETYGGCEIKPGAQVLLTTDEPTNSRNLAWARTEGRGRVVYLQLGHDRQAYENPKYQQLVAQALQWVGGR